METSIDQIRLYNALRNSLKMPDQDASEFISALSTMNIRELDAKIQTLATKDDLRELNQKMNFIGLVQFIAIVGNLLTIVKLMH